MSGQASTSDRDPAIRRRRRVLYVAAAIALVLIAAVAAKSLIDGGPKPQVAPKLTAPVIVARIEMRPTSTGRARGLGEILRRGDAESLRVLIARLKPSTGNRFYQLVLAGGSADERVLGSQKVGSEGVFVGETSITLEELQRHKRLELRQIKPGPPVAQRTILRGRIPE